MQSSYDCNLLGNGVSYGMTKLNHNRSLEWCMIKIVDLNHHLILGQMGESKSVNREGVNIK